MTKPYSQIYEIPSKFRKDDARARLRLARLFGNLPADSASIGKEIELKLGIKVVSSGPMSIYVDWEKRFKELELTDIFDIIFIDKTIGHKYGKDKEFIYDVNQIFDERHLDYTVDVNGTVHPRVDQIFTAETNQLIKHLNREEHSSAIAHVNSALDFLTAKDSDNRASIRSVFDAVENLYKQKFGVTHVNSKTIDKDLTNFLAETYAAGSVELRSSEKLRVSFKEWVNSAHNYRHEAGKPEPSQPPEEIAITLISQGFSFVRWLAYLAR